MRTYRDTWIFIYIYMSTYKYTYIYMDVYLSTPYIHRCLLIYSVADWKVAGSVEDG